MYILPRRRCLAGAVYNLAATWQITHDPNKYQIAGLGKKSVAPYSVKTDSCYTVKQGDILLCQKKSKDPEMGINPTSLLASLLFEKCPEGIISNWPLGRWPRHSRMALAFKWHFCYLYLLPPPPLFLSKTLKQGRVKYHKALSHQFTPFLPFLQPLWLKHLQAT